MENSETFYFADLILPLALSGTYTYQIPVEFTAFLKIGQRVIVPFGRGKTTRWQLGVVLKIHQHRPSYPTKFIASILDEEPLIFAKQLEFWQWLSQYYCCPLGLVLQNALPAGLKLQKDEKLSLHPNFSAEDVTLDPIFSDPKVGEMAEKILELFIHLKILKLEELEKKLDPALVNQLLPQLLKQKILISFQEVQEKYKPKLATFIGLNSEYESEEMLKNLFKTLEKSDKQLQVLLAYIQLKNKYQQKWIKKTDFLKESSISSSSLETLIKKNILITTQEQIQRIVKNKLTAENSLPNLSLAQEKSYSEILTEFTKNNIVLLHGITGSGKTEIYIHLIAESLKKNEQILLLIPEIALTVQLVQRLQKYFSNKVNVYHSKFGLHERTEIWENLTKNNNEFSSCVVVGSRTSIFLPFKNLKLIVIDEEHERSFKQNTAPNYQGRDSALKLAQLHGAKVLLSSATPSVETYVHAQEKKYGLVVLKERFGSASLPDIVIIKKSQKEIFSPELLLEVRKVLASKDQVLLFQNRKAYHPVLLCNTCGWKATCMYCDVSLAYYKSLAKLKCAYCGYTETLTKRCPACQSVELEPLGVGTEKIEEQIQLLFPEAVVQRMDSETTRHKGSYQKIIEDFEDRKIDILVGTQMISKGLDFAHVALVGILDADALLAYPDFRTHEQAIQLLLQVSGRTGRRRVGDKVLIQASNLNHPILALVKNYDLASFYNKEIEERKTFYYPPFVRLVKVKLQDKDPKIASESALNLAFLLKQKLQSEIQVLGPSKGIVEKINLFYIQQILIKIPKPLPVSQIKLQLISIAEQLKQAKSTYKNLQIFLDVDPM